MYKLVSILSNVYDMPHTMFVRRAVGFNKID